MSKANVNYRNWILSFVLLVIPIVGMSQRKNVDRQRKEAASIHTVRMFRTGWEFSQPLLELNGNQTIELSFDDLTGQVRNLYYTIVHCDRNWVPSRLHVSEYLTGFSENPIQEYATSVNTTLTYVNYHLKLPNEQVGIKLSGNYLIQVFEEGNRDKVLVSARFYVVENLTQLSGMVKKSTYEGYRGASQEVDFELYCKGIALQDPRNDLSVVIKQNGREDQVRTGFKPILIKDDQLTYALNKDQVFLGGNEFRNFDLKDLQIPGRGVAGIEYRDPIFYITLKPDDPRNRPRYELEEDLNGKYMVRNIRAGNSDLESDYCIVKFSLRQPEPVLGGDIYVIGSLNEWQNNDKNRMKWNHETKCYEVEMIVKQGFYDYQYLYVGKEPSPFDSILLEGSYVETENDYQLYVYYHPFSSRYDRLIGFTNLNSVKK